MTRDEQREVGGMARGDHVFVRRGRHYSHHGIDCGDGSVIHYEGTWGTVRYIARTPMASFSAGDEVLVRDYETRLDPDATVAHAESKLGDYNYSLVRNNCEHFAAWCCTGRAASSQVRRWTLAAHGTVASLVAVQSLGAHLAILGTLGAGLYAAVSRRRSRGRATA